MKELVNPFGWFLLLAICALVVLWWRGSGMGRGMARALLVATLGLAAFSTPSAQRLLEASLAVEPAAETREPQFIFVLGGGYVPGSTEELDVLVVESMQRAAEGVLVWRDYPAAQIVFSGRAPEGPGGRGADRLVRLMADVASARGVPDSAVVLEPRSSNTREHPLEALTLTGVTAASRIAIVTSSWHARRALREFCRYFDSVQVFPAQSFTPPARWSDVIPTADSLDSNTTLLREWIAIGSSLVANPRRRC